MPKLAVLNHVSLDGILRRSEGRDELGPRRPPGPGMGRVRHRERGRRWPLVFGRVTYQMMAGFWPTPMAMKTMPEVAERMNQMAKVVFSRTLDQVSWNNTTLVKGDLVEEMRRRKTGSGPDMTILGSGSLVSQLAPAELIDEYQVVVNPIVLGGGRTMFDGLPRTLTLRRTSTRAFGNGNVLLCYQPLA